MERPLHFDPGQLRHRLTLQENRSVPDGQGGFSDDWQTVRAVWAAFRKANSALRLQMDDEEPRVTRTVIIRAGHGAQANMRLLDGGDIWTIRAVHDPDGTGRYEQCDCVKERTP